MDPDNLSSFGIVKAMTKMGYTTSLQQILYWILGLRLKEGLRELYRDNSVIELIGHLRKWNSYKLYILHSVYLPQPIEIPLTIKIALVDTTKAEEEVVSGSTYAIVRRPTIERKGSEKGKSAREAKKKCRFQKANVIEGTNSKLIGEGKGVEDTNDTHISLQERIDSGLDLCIEWLANEEGCDDDDYEIA